MLNQVNKVLFKQYLLRQFLRYTHNDQATSKVLYPLESRKLLRIAGTDAPVFLQGLITNDMRHFEDGANSMYAMFLNNKGRVLYDTLIHKPGKEESFLIECDKNVINPLQRHLKLFKLKRKIDIEDASREYKIWAFVAPPNTISEAENHSNSNIHIHKDPRLAELGYRILGPAYVTENNLIDVVGKETGIDKSEKDYKILRYMLGVSEGSEDMPPGTCFPLEVNCDYLHGVSFHKGCYIGQEVTARVHHTGVVRKRIMPLKFSKDVQGIEKDSVISASNMPKSNLGKIKGFVDNYGIGLVRIKEVMDAKTLKVGEYLLEVVKPTWWPIEAPKEKGTLNKVE